MNLNDVMDCLAARLRTIDSLSEKVTAYPTPSVTPPAGFPGWPDEWSFDGSYGNGLGAVTIPVWVVVADAKNLTTRNALAAYAAGSGASSVKAALEQPAPGEVDTPFWTLQVTGGATEYTTIGNIEYLGLKFDVKITGPGE